MITVTVGTFVKGFDELVQAADHALWRAGTPGFAQIGHGSVIPDWLAWQRFLSPEALRRQFAASSLIVTHAGMGLVGDALRQRKPVVIVPRRGPTTADHPANDQRAFARRLASVLPVVVCEEPGDLRAAIERARDLSPADHELGSDAPQHLVRYLRHGPRPRARRLMPAFLTARRASSTSP